MNNFDFYSLEKADIESIRNRAINNWIYNRVKDMVREHHRYTDFVGFFAHVKKAHYRNLEKVTIDYGITDCVMVIFHYVNTYKRVFFIDTYDEPSTMDYYKNLIVFDFSNIKIK